MGGLHSMLPSNCQDYHKKRSATHLYCAQGTRTCLKMKNPSEKSSEP